MFVISAPTHCLTRVIQIYDKFQLPQLFVNKNVDPKWGFFTPSTLSVNFCALDYFGHNFLLINYDVVCARRADRSFIQLNCRPIALN